MTLISGANGPFFTPKARALSRLSALRLNILNGAAHRDSGEWQDHVSAAVMRGRTETESAGAYQGDPASFVRRQLILDDYYDAVLTQRVALRLRTAVPTTASFHRLLRLLQLGASKIDSRPDAVTCARWRVTDSQGIVLVEGTIASIHRTVYNHARFQWRRVAHLQLAAARYFDCSAEEQGLMQAWLRAPGDLRVEHSWQLTFDALGIVALRDIAPLPIRWISWYLRRRFVQDRADHEDWTDELTEWIASASARRVAAACGVPSSTPARRRL